MEKSSANLTLARRADSTSSSLKTFHRPLVFLSLLAVVIGVLAFYAFQEVTPEPARISVFDSSVPLAPPCHVLYARVVKASSVHGVLPWFSITPREAFEFQESVREYQACKRRVKW